MRSAASSADCSASGSCSASSSKIRARVSRTSASLGRRSASRRPSAFRMVRPTFRLAGDPVTDCPARRGLVALVPCSERLTRSGSSRSSKKISRNSSRDSTKAKPSSASPSGAPCRRPRPPVALPRLLDVVAWTEGLVAGQHVLATTALGRVVEGRFADTVGRHGDVAAAIDLGDAPLAHRFVDGVLDVGSDPPDETPTVAETLLLGVQPAVDEMGHGAGPVTPPC